MLIGALRQLTIHGSKNMTRSWVQIVRSGTPHTAIGLILAHPKSFLLKTKITSQCPRSSYIFCVSSLAKTPSVSSVASTECALLVVGI
ncbi:hypothetical protein NL676_023040 [Syzygium grande]|nr:hypothetical protein NL676_023040 [Syzygium grande]